MLRDVDSVGNVHVEHGLAHNEYLVHSNHVTLNGEQSRDSLRLAEHVRRCAVGMASSSLTLVLVSQASIIVTLDRAFHCKGSCICLCQYIVGELKRTDCRER